jgi:hypothetical protein
MGLLGGLSSIPSSQVHLLPSCSMLSETRDPPSSEAARRPGEAPAVMDREPR